MNSSYVSFEMSISKGKLGELIFKEDFLEFLGIKYKDVTGCQQFQIIDTDYIANIGGTYEIKASYKDDKALIIEDYTNYQPELGRQERRSIGWIEKSTANLIIFISSSSRVMVFLPMTQRFKIYYFSIRERFPLKRNKPTIKRDGSTWQSAYRKLPFSALSGYISIYKKISEDTPAMCSPQPIKVVAPIVVKLPAQQSINFENYHR